ncbi:DUF2442 domain-containing protein [Methylocella sp.]|uniref:DUF2442 domain-containing protein n=1 Tax=Methylocella sp. TaxID=1978226 RepID=UPI0035B35E25
MSKAFTLVSVKAKAHSMLHLAFADGVEFDVDLSAIIKRYPSLAALSDPAVFRRAKLGAWGGAVTWGKDDLELAADNLRARAVEQAGGYSHEGICEMMHRNKLTQQQAATALGLSRRMLTYYLSGEKPIPRTVALACIGWEQAKHDARFAPAA